MIKSKVFIFFPIIIVILFIFIFLTRPIKIGVLYSLDSSVGNEQNLACQFFANNNKRIGLRKVNLIFENPKMDRSEIIKSFHRLNNKGVVAIIGAALSFEGVIVAPLAEQYNIPFLSPTTSTSALTNKKDNFYQFIMNTNSQGQNAGRYLNQLNIKKTALILSKSNKAFSESLADAYIEGFYGESIKIFNEPDNPAFNGLKEFQPDSIFFIVPSNELITYLAFIRTNLPEAIIVTSSWGYQQLLQAFSGPQLNGIWVVTITDEKMVEPYFSESLKFEEQYKLKPTFIFGFAYSALLELYNGIKSNGANREKIIEYFDTPRHYSTPYDINYMNEYGDTVAKYYFIFEIIEDKLVFKEKYPISEFPND